MRKIDCSLYLVTDGVICPREKVPYYVEEAIKGGVSAVQLREKEISSRDFYNMAIKIKEITSRYNVPLIINDRIDIALAVDADGVHIGQSDIPASVARKILGKDKILGLSAGDAETAIKAVNDGADYIGVGAVFPTGSKKDAKNVGKEALYKIKRSVDIPIVAIGGINEGNVSQIFGSQVDGIAVISAIMGSENPFESAKRLKAFVKNL